MPFRIIRNDITKMPVDVIVNTANPEAAYGAGTDQAIYEAAGVKKLLAERRKIGPIRPGEVAVTYAFHLPSRFIIHTVGPKWIDGTHGEFDILSSCYTNSLMLARQLHCKSIAFPLISTGTYGFPKDEALRIAIDRIREFLDENEMDVTLVVFDQKSFVLSKALTAGVEEFIDERYAESRRQQYMYGGSNQGFQSAGYRRPGDMREGAPSPGDGWRAAQYYRDVETGASAPSKRSLVKDLWEKATHKVTEESRGDLDDSYEDSDSYADAAVFEDSDSYEESDSYADAAVFEDSDSYAEADSYADAGPWANRKENRRESNSFMSAPSASYDVSGRSLDDLMNHVGETFQECLLRLIDERGVTDAEVYKKANVDRKLFSKIRCNTFYNPTKRTALALAIALQLNLDETIDLLRRAGLALSPSSKADLIVEYCIVNHIYDIFQIDALLFNYNQQTLG